MKHGKHLKRTQIPCIHRYRLFTDTVCFPGFSVPINKANKSTDFMGLIGVQRNVYEKLFEFVSSFFHFLFGLFAPVFSAKYKNFKTILFAAVHYSYSSFYNQRGPMQRLPRSCCSVKKVGPPGGRRPGFEPELPYSSLVSEPPSYAAPPNLAMLLVRTVLH